MFKIEDKRRFLRIKLQAPLRYQVRGCSDYCHVLSDNVSLNGLGFTSENFIQPNTLLMLQVKVLSRLINPIARIAWSSVLPHTDTYKVGVEFIEFDPQERKYLQDYLDLQTQQL